MTDRSSSICSIASDYQSLRFSAAAAVEADDAGVAAASSGQIQSPSSSNIGCSTIMSTTIVFACKSNSCRSQMAEAWAKEWIKAERRELESSGGGGDGEDDGVTKLRAFVDGLFVASVALDETCVAPTNDEREKTSACSMEPKHSPRDESSLTSTFECNTCDGEVCPLSARRRHPKEMAVRAMAHDGVDISNYERKSFRDIFHDLLGHHDRRHYVSKERIIDMTKRNWRSQLLIPRISNMLENASRDMGMAFAGIPRKTNQEVEKGDTQTIIADGVEYSSNTTTNTNSTHLVDNLIVLCLCPESLTRPLANVSKEMMNWDVDPPSTAALTEGEEVAFLRVSRQIRHQVNEFMNQLKSCVLS